MHLLPGFGILAAPDPFGLRNPGIGDEQIERLVRQPLVEGGDGGEVAHVQRFDPNVEGGERVRFPRLPDGGDHLPALGGILAGEFEADAPAGACDQDPRHQSNRLDTLVSSAMRLIASASRGAIGKARIRGLAVASSLNWIESVMTSSESCEFSTRVTAAPERTPWVQ